MRSLQARIAELENEVRLQKSNAGGAYERIAELEKSRINRITCDFTDCQWQRKGKRLDAALGKIIEAYGIHDYCSIVARKARKENE